MLTSLSTPRLALVKSGFMISTPEFPEANTTILYFSLVLILRIVKFALRSVTVRPVLDRKRQVLSRAPLLALQCIPDFNACLKVYI